MSKFNYRFSSNLDEKDYYQFLAKQDKYYFTQLPEWSIVKCNWGHTLCGLYLDGRLVAAASLLIKSLPLGLKMIYISRGPLLPYDNSEIVKSFVDELKKYAKSINAFYIKCDPFIYHETKDLKQDCDSSLIFKDTLQVLNECGFKHFGFSKGLNDFTQARYNMPIALFDDNGAYTNETLLKKMPKKTRYYMSNSCSSKGLEFLKASENDDLSIFVEMLKKTEERQGIHLRNLEYFTNIKKAFKDRACVYYGRIDMNKYINYLQIALKDAENKENHQKKIDEAVNLKKENGDIIYLCAALVIYPRDDANEKVAEYLYAGSNLDVLSTLCASVGMIYYACCDALEKGCQYFNLGGVAGTFDDHLSKFKLKFDPNIWEYIGEFDLPVNKPLYFIFNKMYPFLKKFLRLLK